MSSPLLNTTTKVWIYTICWPASEFYGCSFVYSSSDQSFLFCGWEALGVPRVSFCLCPPAPSQKSPPIAGYPLQVSLFSTPIRASEADLQALFLPYTRKRSVSTGSRPSVPHYLDEFRASTLHNLTILSCSTSIWPRFHWDFGPLQLYIRLGRSKLPLCPSYRLLQVTQARFTSLSRSLINPLIVASPVIHHSVYL